MDSSHSDLSISRCGHWVPSPVSPNTNTSVPPSPLGLVDWESSSERSACESEFSYDVLSPPPTPTSDDATTFQQAVINSADSVRREQAEIRRLANRALGYLATRKLEENWDEFEALSEAQWGRVLAQLLTTLEDQRYGTTLIRLLEITDLSRRHGVDSWGLVARWAVDNNDKERLEDLVNVWTPGAPESWFPLVLRWSVQQRDQELTRVLLGLGLPIPNELPFGYSPMTLELQYGDPDRAMVELNRASIGDFFRVIEGLTPLNMAFRLVNDRLAAAMIRRMPPAAYPLPEQLDLAVDLYLDETIRAMLDAGFCPGLPAKDFQGSTLLKLMVFDEDIARAAVAALRRSAHDPDRVNAALIAIGRECLDAKAQWPLLNLIRAGVDKAVLDCLLSESIHYGNHDAVAACVAAGADSMGSANNRVGSLLGPAAYAEHYYGSDKALVDLLPTPSQDMKERASELVSRQRVAHTYRMGGQTSLDGHHVPLTGFWPHHFYEPMLMAVEAVLVDCEPSERPIVAQIAVMIDRLLEQPTSAETAAEVGAGMPCLVPMGGNGHVVYGLFARDRYHLCNKGAHKGVGPVEAYGFPAAAATEDLFDEIEDYKTRPLAGAMAFLRSLPGIQEPGMDLELTAFLRRAWRGQTSQTVGNCTLESLLTGIYTYILINCAWDPNIPAESVAEDIAIDRAYALYKKIRQALMVGEIENFVGCHIGQDGTVDTADGLLDRVREVAGNHKPSWWDAKYHDRLRSCGVNIPKPSREGGRVKQMRRDNRQQVKGRYQRQRSNKQARIQKPR